MSPEQEPTPQTPEEKIKARERAEEKRREDIRADFFTQLDLLVDKPLEEIQAKLEERVLYSGISMNVYDSDYSSAVVIELQEEEIAGWIVGNVKPYWRIALLRDGRLAAFDMKQARHVLVEFEQLDVESVVKIDELVVSYVAKYETA